MSEQHSINIALNNQWGLHARPAFKLAALARTFESDIEIVTSQGQKADGKDMGDLLLLRATSGQELTIRANGTDRQRATTAIADLIRSDFERIDEKENVQS